MNEQSVYGRPVTGRKPPYARALLWIMLGVVALPALAFGVIVVWLAASDDPFGGSSEAVDCAAALESAGFEALPAAAEPECTEGGFQDPFVTIDFVAPQADVDAWLRSELPGTELRDEGCVDVDGCLQIGYGEPDAPESGWSVDLGTVDRGDGTVAVAIMAYSM